VEDATRAVATARTATRCIRIDLSVIVIVSA
jgi:hypothetical protein